MIKKFLIFFLSIGISLAGFLTWFYLNTLPVGNDPILEDFLILKGSSASSIGAKLYKEGFIKSPFTFKFYVQMTGKSKKIQAGEYRLSASFSLFEVVERLTKGPVEIWVTIPEGLRREEVAKRFADSLDKDEIFVEEFLSSSAALEGYLFPDTYLFPKTASASGIINKMTKTFASRTSDLNLTKNQVILASLIERETKTDQERPIVAGILMNRLSAGMALQVDATVQYAKGNWGPIVREDLLIDSAYNTYKFKGLPPSPIANPGFSSLSAAYHPEGSSYFYYIHDSKGNIYYAKTLEEHNINIRKYLGS